MKKKDDTRYATLIAQSKDELAIKTAAHDRLWQIGSADWSVEQDSGKIVFRSPNGMVATADVQIIGTYNTQDQTWLWGWDHPSVIPALQKHAEKLKAYGLANGQTRLTKRKLNCTETECWEFAALACKLCEAQGAYRGPSGETFVFMTFGKVELTTEGS